jgi:excisionase family DNA binding protein
VKSQPHGEGGEVVDIAEGARFGQDGVIPLLDAAGAAELLNVPESWVRAQARADRIPWAPFGRYVRFDRDELLAWARGRMRGPRARTGADPVSTSGKAA